MKRISWRLLTVWLLALLCTLPAGASGQLIYIQEDGFSTAAKRVLQMVLLHWRELVATAAAVICTVFMVVLVWKGQGKRRKTIKKQIDITTLK